MIAVVFVLGACAPDAGPVREWSAADHDREDPTKNRSGQVQQTKVANEEQELVELAWEKDCERCHGKEGRGDGPMGPGNHVPDLTSTSFLAGFSDDQLASTIRNGKPPMPAFAEAQLPDHVVTGLVRRIRARSEQ